MVCADGLRRFKACYHGMDAVYGAICEESPRAVPVHAAGRLEGQLKYGWVPYMLLSLQILKLRGT